MNKFLSLRINNKIKSREGFQEMACLITLYFLDLKPAKDLSSKMLNYRQKLINKKYKIEIKMIN